MILKSFKRKLNQFINRRGKESLPVTFDWRRIYVLPSKPGLFFAIIWFLMMMAGLNFNNNMSLMLVFLLFGLAQVLLYRTFFNLRNLRLEMVTAQPVFLGEDIHLKVTVGSNDPKWQICATTGKTETIENIPDQTTQLTLPSPSIHRGWQTTPRLKFFTRYPIGLFTVWAYCIPDAKALVYPRPEVPCPDFPDHGGADGQQTIAVKGDELSSIRDYRQGDPIRDIAWKKSAQSNQTWVKEFNQVRGKNLLFDLTQMDHDSLEFKLSRMTAWVLQAEKQQAEYQLVLPGFDSGMSSGQTHQYHCLQALALYQPGTSS
ncbi:MAG: DUF58 domain-containing protein [Xanthomonadales bacterium]|nr:DUF58 domain-containing protein [Xanthomonadales bacterium]